MPWIIEDALAYSEQHIAVWNAYDFDEIVGFYSEDVELTSPFAEQILGSSRVRGRDQLRSYFETAIEANPELQFELVDVLRGVDGITVYMRIGGRLVADVLFVGAARTV